MKFSEIEKKFKPLGLPIAFYEFEEPPTVPFLAYLNVANSDWHADDTAFIKAELIRLELYTDFRDLKLEAKIEKILEANEVGYEYDFFKNEKDDLFVTIYSFYCERN